MSDSRFSESINPEDAIAAVRIILVSPAGPLNVGSVARVMKNFGLNQLVLVTPQCDPLGPEALQMAVHADDILRAAQRVKTIPEALIGCERAIATTARIRGFNAPLPPPESVLPTLLTPTNAQTAIIFGPEDRGLSNEELTHAQAFTKIPTSATYSALNLAQAVAVCCYELSRASRLADSSAIALQKPPSSDKQTEYSVLNKAKLEELESYYQHLESVLLKVEYLYPHTAASRMRKFKQLLNKATPTSNEVALLRGILRQVEWALSNSSKGSEQNKGSDSN